MIEKLDKKNDNDYQLQSSSDNCTHPFVSGVFLLYHPAACHFIVIPSKLGWLLQQFHSIVKFSCEYELRVNPLR